MKKFFELSEKVTSSSPEPVRRQAIEEARKLKSVLSGARIRVEESAEHVNGTGLINRYAPRSITAYGTPEQFSRYATEIGNTVTLYCLKDEDTVAAKRPMYMR